MTNPEYLVVAVGLLAGYWMVSAFMSGSKGEIRHLDADAPLGQDIDQEFAKAGATDWAVTLGISSAATVEEIRMAYKDQMGKYHPDKVAALGVELRELADRKSKEINIAYKRAMKERNVAEQLW
jgi:hypothetical protein